MKKLLRLAALSVLALSLTTGVAAANSGSIDTTGPDSYNKVEFENRNHVRVDNDNRIHVVNNNPQHAYSGDASVRHNTTGGDAESGAAKNDSLVRANISSNNSGASAAALAGSGNGSSTGSVSNTGPDSYNKVVFNDSSSVKVNNSNSVSIVNNNSQHASSGDAKVSGNTTGGNATSGDASNISTVDLTFTSVN